MGSFPDFFETFPKENKIFQTIWNIDVGLKAFFHEIIRKKLSGKFSRTSGNFSRAPKFFPDNLKY